MLYFVNIFLVKELIFVDLGKTTVTRHSTSGNWLYLFQGFQSHYDLSKTEMLSFNKLFGNSDKDALLPWILHEFTRQSHTKAVEFLVLYNEIQL